MNDEVFCKCGEVLGYRNTLTRAFDDPSDINVLEIPERPGALSIQWGTEEPVYTLATNYIRHKTERGHYHYCARPRVDERGFVTYDKATAVKDVLILEPHADIEKTIKTAKSKSQLAGKRVIVPNHTEIVWMKDLPATIKCRRCEKTQPLPPLS